MTEMDPPALCDDPMQPAPYRVVSRREDAPDVVTVTLAAVAAGLAAPAPGQFVMVWIPAVGEIPISVGGITASHSLELTVRAVGAVSSALVAAPTGEVVGLRGPYGTAWPLAGTAGRDVVVMAGGLGLAPLRLAIRSLVGGAHAPRSVTVLIGARVPAQLVYADEYDAWEAHGARVATTVDVGDGSWYESLGTVTDLLDDHGLSGVPGNGLAFVCGPEVMMTSGARALVERGMPRRQVFLSLERNMHCGVAKCGRCQLGPLLLCRDGPVVRWDRVGGLMAVGER
ncbi:MAG: FAD/NAD(P)-binding protein [Acidimicrobiales bacterium]